jgi:hypothetical protein
MRIKPLVTVTTALVLTASLAQAQHVWNDPSGWWNSHFTYDQNTPKYTAQEVSVDLFGSYINPEGKFTDLFKTNIRHGFFGGGAGLNYFLTREIGLGADFNMSDKRGTQGLDMVDQYVGDVIFRLPLGNSGLAPYAIGSGGRAFNPRDEWVYGGGVGMEYRFNPATGVFSDARFFWADKATADNNLLIRVGFRLAF